MPGERDAERVAMIQYWSRKPYAEIARTIRGSCAGLDDAKVAAISANLRATGSCVWHAAAEVCGTRCWCQDCRPDVMRFA